MDVNYGLSSISIQTCLCEAIERLEVNSHMLWISPFLLQGYGPNIENRTIF